MGKKVHKNFDTIASASSAPGVLPEENTAKESIEEIVEKAPSGGLFSFLYKKPVKGKKPKGFSRNFLPAIITTGVLMFFILAAFGAAYAYNNAYKNKAFLGTVVWGEDVSGKTITEIQKSLSTKVLEYKLSIKGPDQEYVAASTDLGLIANVDEMASQAIQIGREEGLLLGYKNRLYLLLSKSKLPIFNKVLGLNELEIKPKISFDEAKFNSYITSVGDNIRITAQDSEVKITKGTATLKPAIYGREVNLDKLVADIKNNVTNFQDSNIAVEVKKIKPAIIDNAAQDVMVQAENVMKRPVILTYQGEEYRPSQETVSSWISFSKESGTEIYKLFVDQAKMAGYLSFLSTKINIAPIPKKIRIENNVKESVTQEGKDGLAVDSKVLSGQIALLLPTQLSVKVEIPTYIDKFKTTFERVVVENDEKYIVIDISEQVMTAYLKGGQVVGSWGVVTGNPNLGRSTPQGKWLVMGHSASVNMTDGSYCNNWGGTNGTYCLPGVQWVTWFKGGGFAIHDADDWRNSSMYGNPNYYKYDGSHGCVNSPNWVAKFIFDWAPVGTPVYVQE